MRKLVYNKKSITRKRNFLIFLSVMLIAGLVVFNNRSKIFNKKEYTADSNKEIINKGPNSKDQLQNSARLDEEGHKAVTDVKAEKYAVVSSNPVASQVAMQVLKDGGNAVDAAVALSFSLNVTDPQNSGIGGGGGMMVYDTKTGKKVFYDYYIQSGDAQPVNNIGIPGFLKGMEQLSNDLGNMHFSKVLDYPIALAEKGVIVTKEYSRILNSYNYISQVYPAVNRPDGTILQEGDLFKQPDLIKTLKAVKESGSEVFYGGQHKISRDFLNLTGISQESLANYKVRVTEPLEATYKGYNILAPKGPFSGMTVLQNLILEEKLNIPEKNAKNEDYNNKIKSLYKFTAREGRKYISNDNTIDYNSLLDRDSLYKNYHSYDGNEGYYVEPESESTTAFSVIDKDGMIVSGTNTISSFWGSYNIQNGIIYNNAMKNFSHAPNDFAFNKRPKTGISPLIITGADGYMESLGSNGGAQIPTYLTQYLINTKKYSMLPQDANDFERSYYLKGLMHFEINAPIYTYEKEEDINFKGKYKVKKSSYGWGIMDGLVFTRDGRIIPHNDKRNYFYGGGTYVNGDLVYPDPNSSQIVK